MLAQVAAITLALAGYFFNLPVALVLGGYACVFVDIYGIITKRTKPVFPVFFYLGGFLLTGKWLGVLYGAIIHSCVDLLRTFVVYLAMLNKKNK